MFARGIWTPDEPREADIAWRMTWQPQKAVPLLAGEAFCEKPPLTYWVAAAPMRVFGASAWAARLPNLLYAIIAAWSIGLLAGRSLGRLASLVATAAMGTLLLSYQVAIWLATDAPLLAATAVAMLGAYRGFYADSRRTRLNGYLLMHAALGVGFLSKSAAAWLTPALGLATLVVWERRWRELLRWELYVGLLLQAALILPWVGYVYAGPDGLDHLKVFFWNNLAGRFTHVAAPAPLQYADAHRNSPGKYLIELPTYLYPWTLLLLAAVSRAWRGRRAQPADADVTAAARRSLLRFAIAMTLPTLIFLSCAATARNVYLATAMPGTALLLAWWAEGCAPHPARTDFWALRATSGVLWLSTIVVGGALIVLSVREWQAIAGHVSFTLIALGGEGAAAYGALRAWQLARDPAPCLYALLLSFCALLAAPLSQIYRHVDTWQNLAQIAHDVQRDTSGLPLVLLAPDETTRAIVDMHARTDVIVIPGPLDSRAFAQVHSISMATPASRFLLLIPRHFDKQGALDAAGLQWEKRYTLPHGREYGVLAPISR